MDGVLTAILAASGLLSVLCWVALWRGRGHLLAKVLWTFLAAVPGMGPLLFAVLRDPPPIQPEVDQAMGGDWDTAPSMGHAQQPDRDG